MAKDYNGAHKVIRQASIRFYQPVVYDNRSIKLFFRLLFFKVKIPTGGDPAGILHCVFMIERGGGAGLRKNLFDVIRSHKHQAAKSR